MTKTMNLLRMELIGKKAKVKGSNIEGFIIDETRNTLTIRTEKDDKRLVKQSHDFTIDGEEIDGKTIAIRPEERIKSKWKKPNQRK